MPDLSVSGLVYVIDDDVEIRKSICSALTENNFEVHEFANGMDLLDGVHKRIPDLIVLDWVMTPLDGLTICGRLRLEKSTNKIPIIMVTSKNDEIDCVLAFEMGIDDYMRKPFSVKELVARIKATLRRRNLNYSIQNNNKEDVLSIGDLRINLANRTITKNSKFIDLTMKEFDLLINLINENSKILTREQLMNRVWDVDFCGDARTVDVHVRYLRQKIEDQAENPKYVKTVRGIGYRFASGEELQQLQ
ncbi:MAG: response regulator transcription factor [Candidatus Improbicoccus pseudotrichonymphae]|uniref:Stage 0 sporulation protein A homolog n=1 Tax=Candidatus Improbicoccus pseudotrichonymphae TaxID=3033792 RepID=A0AA48HV24_9FIRM|nr:MAG: response regulator transcription factor [Candidatus Improbicoccus pseudotrichonymphae]